MQPPGRIREHLQHIGFRHVASFAGVLALNSSALAQASRHLGSASCGLYLEAMASPINFQKLVEFRGFEIARP